MKFALMGHVSNNHACWGREQAILQICQRAKKLGFDGIDWLDDCGVNPKEIRRITDDFGLPSVCFTPLSVDLNFSSAKERQAGLDAVKKAAETAVILGTDKIMLPMGGKPQFTTQESRRNVIAGLVEAVQIAAYFRITVTVEHYGDERAPFRISDDVNEAVRAVPGLRVTYDSGNVWLGGENAADGFVRSRENIVHAHFKDLELVFGDEDANAKRYMMTQSASGKKYVMAPIGRGLVDHEEVLRVMQASRYSGYVDLEYFGTKYETDAVLSESLKFISLNIRPKCD